MLPTDLAHEWRTKAAEFRELTAEGQAAGIDWCAKQFEEWWRVHETEPLTLQEAAVESGYSHRHLRRIMENGTIPNSGSPESPRLIRSHLPRKPGHGIARHGPKAASSITQVARAIATRGEDNRSA